MIDISLVDQEVNIEKYSEFKEKLPTLFLGFAIKNEYDNVRLKICDSFKPERQLFLFEKRKTNKFGLLPLYGLFLDLNDLGKKLANTLLEQDLNDKLTLQSYENILDEYNVSCHNSYSYLNKRIYPLDFKHFTELTDSNLKNDKKILQHMLQIDEDKFDFQQFGSFKLLILA